MIPLVKENNRTSWVLNMRSRREVWVYFPNGETGRIEKFIIYSPFRTKVEKHRWMIHLTSHPWMTPEILTDFNEAW
jgi:hypothetical protein